MLCTVWLQKQLVPRDTDRRTCENCSPHLHSSKISLSSAMSKKREKKCNTMPYQEGKRQSSQSKWVGKTSKTKTYKEHGPTIGRKFWLCSHTDIHKRDEKPTPCPPHLTCALCLVSGSGLCMGRRGRWDALRRHGKTEGWISLWQRSRVVLSSECSQDTHKDLADIWTMLHWF